MPCAQLLFMAAFMFKRHYNACSINHHINTPYTQKKKHFQWNTACSKTASASTKWIVSCVPFLNFLLFSMVLFSFHFHFLMVFSFPLLLSVSLFSFTATIHHPCLSSVFWSCTSYVSWYKHWAVLQVHNLALKVSRLSLLLLVIIIIVSSFWVFAFIFTSMSHSILSLLLLSFHFHSTSFSSFQSISSLLHLFHLW